MKFKLNISNRFYESIADISLLLVSLCWGSTFVVIKKALNEIPVLDFLFLRFLLATFCMLPLFVVKYKFINIKSIGAGIFLGILLFLLFACQTIGIAYSKSAEAAFITGSYIIYTPIFSVLILKKKPYKSSIYGVIIAFVGLLVMTLRWDLRLGVGEFYLILNAIFLALHIIYVDKFSRVYNIFVLVFIQFLTMTIVFYISLILSSTPVIKIDYSPYVIFSLVYTAVFASVVAYLVQVGLQRYTTPTKTAILFAAEPLSAPFFSYFIIGELLQVKQYIGASLIMIGILVSEVGSTKRKKQRYS